ncbi:MAG: hypothetical protein M3N53_06840 [Actinomycetota bacterium]|nr:hypothetical protein [Actinomycetota bacterium]
MTERTRKTRAAATLVVLAFVALNALGPVASAQVSTDIPGTSDPIGTVTDTVDSTTKPVQETVGTTKDPVQETIGTTKPVQDGIGNTTGGAVKDTTDTVTDTGGSTIDQTQKTVDDTTKSTGETATSTTDTVSGTASGGGGVINPDLTVKNPLEPKDLDGDGKVSTKERNLQNTAGGGKKAHRAAYRDSLSGDGRRDAAARAKRSALFDLEKKSRLAAANRTPVAIAPPQREGFITQLTKAAVEATKKLAFPLGLALMVGAFLMVQGRIDRKDAKLALAPIDSEQDLLSFQ